MKAMAVLLHGMGNMSFNATGRLLGVGNVAVLRIEMLTVRQKRLFQMRPTFENSLTTLMGELARGSALSSGVDSVRGAAQASEADQLHHQTPGLNN